MSQPSKPPRPHPSTLPPVADHEEIWRGIPHDGFDFTQPDGNRLTDALFPRGQWHKPVDSFGPSVFVASKLPEGLASLVRLDPAWETRGIVCFRVSELRRFDITIPYSPDDCEYDDAEVRAAHGTFLGIRDRDHRGDIIQYLQSRVWRPPRA